MGTTASPLSYDAAGRLSGIPGIVTSVVYDASGRPITQSDANGAVTNRVYSAERGFLTDIQSVVGAATIQNFHYTADAAGMLESVTSPFSNETWSYQYDDLHHMTQATDQDNPSASQSFSYDALGRITYNSRLGNYTYPVDGSARPHAPTTAGANSYSYDADGNLSSGAGRTLSWDAENRVTQVTVGSLATTFTYGASRERLKKVSGGTTSLYPMGDDYEVTNGVVTKYISAGGLGVVAKRVGATTYWLHTERLGSIEAITDASAAVVQRRSYRPYGDKLADSTSHLESRGWIDQRQDETGLTYLHARYYDPQLGVFASPDPIGTAGGLNEFGYSSGDPISRSDRTGLSDCNYTINIFGVRTDGAPCPPSAPSAPSPWLWSGVLGDLGNSKFRLLEGIAAFAKRETKQDLKDALADRDQSGTTPTTPTTPTGGDPMGGDGDGNGKTGGTGVPNDNDRIVGASGSLIVIGGFTASVGVYQTPATGDAGLLFAAGPGAGWDVGGNIYGGEQQTSAVESWNLMANGGPPVGPGLSIPFDPVTSQQSGFFATAQLKLPTPPVFQGNGSLTVPYTWRVSVIAPIASFAAQFVYGVQNAAYGGPY